MYALDQQAAREADQIGSYLNETGKYKGRFLRAEKLLSKQKGTHGVGFTFEAEDKRTTRFDVWTINGKKEHLPGYKFINALLACMKVRQVTEGRAKVDRYNWDTKQVEQVEATVFPELMNKSVGLVLRNTEYEKMRDGMLTGETGWRLEPVLPFDAEHEFTSSEILDRKTKPEKLAAVLATLVDRPLKKRTATPASDHSAAQPRSGGSGFEDMDDDIPFIDPLKRRGAYLVM